MVIVSYLKKQGVSGKADGVSWVWACKWMERVKEVGKGEREERSRNLQSSAQTQVVAQSQHTPWSQIVGTLGAWYGFTPVFVVWSVCQVEALPHPSVLIVDVCWRLLFVCLLLISLGGCIHALKCCLQPGQSQGEPPGTEQEIVTEIRNDQCLRMYQARNPGVNINLILALADSLLLCVLQEPLPDPNVPHIQALLSRLESVSHTLEVTDVGSEVGLDEVDQSSVVTEKLKLLHTYLQQRRVSLRTLVQVQGDFEASVKNMLQGLDDLWAQLEELHTGVTLFKQETQGHRDLASAQRDTQNLLSVLGDYRNKLQSCQVHLKGSTQLLQELTWSHTHMSNSVNSSSESVWPELLLQSNIEQFDKVQENFTSLEQQISTFQAHLEGLGKQNQEKHAGPLTHAGGPHLYSVPPQTSYHAHSKVSVEHRNSTSSSTSASSVDTGTATKTDNTFSLRKRSALHFSSTIGRRLRISGRKK
ncbi:uncharacterized protein LOC102212253 [Pundamilia nyererei]|uniref:Uncharacterized protein LOC102212253 n=1 Tax=Pundamilia nyererei TaxID=303518 RepID=A0A9Y3RFY3_9CICH|nr:PREDICTED: uncharacterized protein LOC102212253 [Pundamilia nyererei]